MVSRPLSVGDDKVGAVAIVRDMTRERMLRDKQDETDRAAFWTELAAAISHEVRNPLVAISTFAQLLPERYEDDEFREEFRDLVEKEIGRLNAMVDQINEFANPPPLRFESLDVTGIVEKAVAEAALQAPGAAIPVHIKGPDDHPKVRGDADALVTCFSHLLVNAMEALADRTKDPSLNVSISSEADAAAPGHVCVRIKDNGRGIPREILDKVYSPFCSMKARGIGLGLPIAKRTITDHNGDMEIQTGKQGTAISVSLPAAEVEKESTT